MKYTVYFIAMLLLLSGCREDSPNAQPTPDKQGQKQDNPGAQPAP